MKIFTKNDVTLNAPYRELVEVLRRAFQRNFHAPPRHHHTIGREGADAAILLLMPAWTEMPDGGRGGYIGLKTVTVMLDNPQRGRPTIEANYFLQSAENGETLAILDGKEITVRRTAAASALAADYLARKEARCLLMVGAGSLAPHVVAAHAAVRPIEQVFVWNRSAEKSDLLAAALAVAGFKASTAKSLEKAVSQADIISCATASTEPLIRGAWVQPGTHIDIMGAFRPEMRETDGEVIGMARVYVDTREGAAVEAGDLIAAASEGYFAMDNIAGDLRELTCGTVAGRMNEEEITLFKSCGTAIEDLAAAIMIYENSDRQLASA